MPNYVTLYLPIRFPVDRINCANCYLCENDPHNRNRLVCRAKPQTINDPTQQGWMCPLVWGKEDKPNGNQ